jgi:TPR repeat protein
VPTIHDAIAAFNARDFATARGLCAELATQGQPVAMYLLGRLAADRDSDRPRDPGLAAEWFFRAWQNGVEEAEREIIRVRVDLETAAAGGSAVAQNALGLILTFGEADPGAAAPWFEKAATQDHPEALRMLGHLLGEGKGVPKDEARAAGLYRRAAELGDAFAQFNLAAMIDQGLGGLTRDVNEAIKWFRRAAEQGMTAAAQRLAELE